MLHQKKNLALLARLHKVQRAIVVTSVLRLPVQIPVPFTQLQSVPEVDILTTTHAWTIDALYDWLSFH